MRRKHSHYNYLILQCILISIGFFITVSLLPAEVRIRNRLGMEFVYIAPGKFIMGSPEAEKGHKNDEIQHLFILTSGYYLQTTEITQGQWQAVMGDNPSHFKKCGANCPVENVSWEDTQKFIDKLNMMDISGSYRLPTEAEWEYACRAGTTTRYSWGNEPLCHKANFGNSAISSECEDISPGSPVPVASYPPNPWGLYDMHGNVWEWCADLYRSYQIPGTAGNKVKNSFPQSGAKVYMGSQERVTGNIQKRVVRGGAYFDPAESSRAANRCWDPADYQVQDLGFRLVRESK